MSKLDTLVQDFLAQRKSAVVGASDKREMGCNAAYKKIQGKWLSGLRCESAQDHL
jgi:hypothetical protein